ncbi:MAG: hypothetical protein U0271_06275 [Polyangiaceae bacterium]
MRELALTALRSLGLTALFAVSACSAAPPEEPARPVVLEVTAAPSVTALPVAPPAEPALTLEAAMPRATELAKLWESAPRYNDVELPRFLAEQNLDPAEVRRVLTAIAADCLAESDSHDPACTELNAAETDRAKLLEPLVELLAELAPLTLDDPTPALLVRLDTRGSWRSDIGVERIMVRRANASRPKCSPPEADAIAAADASLSDFFVLDWSGKHPIARVPTATEREDLAYLYAAIGDSSPKVATFVEDRSAQPLPEGHPDLEKRQKLRERIKKAMLDGDLETHSKTALEYLATLGYPDPMRVREEQDERWGGDGVNYIMRDLARTEELLGHFKSAEALYRRANPGGGMCGTGVEYRFEEQLGGAIRSAESAGDCRATVADRLYAVGRDRYHQYGADVLAQSGFDVPRLYRAALATRGREDHATLVNALAASSFSTQGLARLDDKGEEAWEARIRAVAGFAATAGAAAIPVLLALTDPKETKSVRLDALTYLGLLLEDHGYDPCADGFGFGHYGSGRDIESLMKKCDTHVDRAILDKTAKTLAKQLVNDPDPDLRKALADTLGELGSAAGKQALKELARDKLQNGQLCRSDSAGKEVCEPYYPVASAAKDALEDLAKAEEHRKKH